MKCPRCQHDADAVFCQECGRRLEEACPGCGTANRIEAKFCKKCGQPVAATAVKFPLPVSYTPKQSATPSGSRGSSTHELPTVQSR